MRTWVKITTGCEVELSYHALGGRYILIPSTGSPSEWREHRFTSAWPMTGNGRRETNRIRWRVRQAGTQACGISMDDIRLSGPRPVEAGEEDF